MSDTTYTSKDPAVVEAWVKFKIESEEVQIARNQLAEQVGRGLMVSRLGFGHGTRVVGFESMSDDKPGDVLFDGALRVMKNTDTVMPNLRRKAGKDLAHRLHSLNSPNLDLPGMPAFYIGGDGDGLGLRSMAPELWAEEALLSGDITLYARWPSDSVPVECPPWEQIPLSVYYAAKERHDA